jgi:alpha-tubulin suppressor-like RCC1 family protein
MPSAVGSKVKGDVIFVAFSEALDPTSVNVSSVKVTGPGGAAVTGEVTLLNGGKDIHFTPGSVAVPASLAYDTTYTITLTTAIRDPSHNPLAAQTVWTFNTGRKIAMGFHHTCARFDDGGVKCWGANEYGQLGYDDNVNRGDTFGPHMNTLARVNLGANRTAVALVAGDYFTCARLDNGDTKCWGDNTQGQLGQHTDLANQYLGDAAGEMANLPAIDFGGSHFALELATGEDFACARLDNDTVKCWGLNSSGQLGQGNQTSLGINAGDLAAASAIDLGTGLVPRGLALGHYHACALLQDAGGANHVKCWGDNRWGQLGRGTGGPGKNIGDNTNPDMGPALIDVNFGTGRTATQVYANGGHNCALLDNASVKCWGLNTWAQVGLNANMFATNQLLCDPASNNCVGDEPGELGDTLTAAIPGNVARLAVGARHNCVLLLINGQTNGEVKCWGSNEQGQIGLGDNTTSGKQLIGDAVGEIAGLAATALKAPVVEELSAGGFQTCVWNTDDTLNCWGANDAGQLGHNDTTQWGDGPNEMGASLPNTDLGT